MKSGPGRYGLACKARRVWLLSALGYKYDWGVYAWLLAAGRCRMHLHCIRLAGCRCWQQVAAHCDLKYRLGGDFSLQPLLAQHLSPRLGTAVPLRCCTSCVVASTLLTSYFFPTDVCSPGTWSWRCQSVVLPRPSPALWPAGSGDSVTFLACWSCGWSACLNWCVLVCWQVWRGLDLVIPTDHTHLRRTVASILIDS